MLTCLAKDSLSQFSIQAVELWERLENAETPEDEVDILQAIWEVQGGQEAAIDTQAELADQLDAEIVAIKARLKHLVQVHSVALERLERWRNGLDTTVLRLHSMGAISTNAIGRSRQIAIKENPPSCEVMVDPKELPEEYRTEKVTYAANKKKITSAWAKGIPVDGTHVFRKQKVEYRLVATNSGDQAVAFSEKAEQNGNGSKNRNKTNKARNSEF